MLVVFLEYIFQFLINKALLASNSVDRQNFMGKSLKVDQFFSPLSVLFVVAQ